MRVPILVLFSSLAAPVFAESESLSRVLPIVFYTPDTGFGAGAFMIHNLDNPKDSDPSQFVALAMITQKSQVIALAEPKVYWDGGRWEWSGKLSAQDFPSEYYGRESLEIEPDDSEPYNDARIGIETRLKQIFYERYFWDVELGLGWQNFGLDHDEPTPAVDVEFAQWGKRGEQQNLVIGLGHDNRNGRIRPTDGHVFRTFYRYTRFQTDREDNGGFGLGGFDWKQYVPLSDRQSLAFQLYAAEMDHREVPFYLLQGMGGNQVLRGYYASQFRDYTVAYGQGEWRTLWGTDWGFRVFAGVGAHAQTLGDMEDATGKPAAGVGVDYFLDPKTRNNLRLDFGVSQDNVGVYFLYGNAF